MISVEEWSRRFMGLLSRLTSSCLALGGFVFTDEADGSEDEKDGKGDEGCEGHISLKSRDCAALDIDPYDGASD